MQVVTTATFTIDLLQMNLSPVTVQPIRSLHLYSSVDILDVAENLRNV